MKIHTLCAHNPGVWTGQGNNTYLVVVARPGGPTASLIDAGVGAPRHLDELQAALDAEGAVLDEVLVSHAHGDHASGAEAISRRWPAAVFRKHPWPERDSRYPVPWRALDDGDQVACGRLRVVLTPGHSPDHLSFACGEEATIFTGDLLIQDSTVVIPATSGGNLARYLDSLQRIFRMHPRRLLPAHGPEITEPLKLITQYVAHRRRREEQILEAVRRGLTAPEAIVEEVYEALAESLKSAARENVLAHLEKLVAEGRVAKHGDSFQEVS